MTSEPIYYECVCGYETFVAAYGVCPGCGRDRKHTRQREGNPKRRGRCKNCGCSWSSHWDGDGDPPVRLGCFHHADCPKFEMASRDALVQVAREAAEATERAHRIHSESRVRNEVVEVKPMEMPPGLEKWLLDD